MEFQQLVEFVIQENTTETSLKGKSPGHGILGGLVTDVGKFNHASHHSTDRPGDHWGHNRASHVNYGDHEAHDDASHSRPHQNKMGKHTRGNSLKSPRTSKGYKSKTSKKR